MCVLLSSYLVLQNLCLGEALNLFSYIKEHKERVEAEERKKRVVKAFMVGTLTYNLVQKCWDACMGVHFACGFVCMHMARHLRFSWHNLVVRSKDCTIC